MAKRKRKKTVQEIKRLQREYHDLARSANNRMTRLEKLAKNPEYAAVLGYAYKDAAYDLKHIFGGASRFPQDISRMSANDTNIRKMKQYIRSIKNFLEAPSSTKKGVDKVYRHRASTINRKYKTNFTVNDMHVFFDTTVWKKLNARYSSESALKVVDTVQKNYKEILAEAEEARQNNLTVDYESLKDVEGRDFNKGMSKKDKSVIETLAEMFSHGFEP